MQITKDAKVRIAKKLKERKEKLLASNDIVAKGKECANCIGCVGAT
jgi:hypothetical protein